MNFTQSSNEALLRHCFFRVKGRPEVVPWPKEQRGSSRTVYKTISHDFLQYLTLRLFLHLARLMKPSRVWSHFLTADEDLTDASCRSGNF